MVDSLSNILPVNVVGVVSGTLASGIPTSIFSRANVQNVVIVTEGPIPVALVGSGISGGDSVGLVESTAVFVPFPGSGIDGAGDGSENIKWIFDYDVDVQQATVKTDVGSLTYSLTLDGAVVGGLANQAVTTSQDIDIASSALAYAAGDEIVLAISGATNAQGFRFGLKTERI